MGADAEIYVFDYDRYRRTVVPRLIELIGGAGPTPWFDGVCARLGEFFEGEWRDLATVLQQRPTDLARHCTWLGDDLRHLGAQPASRGAGLGAARRKDDHRLLADLRDHLHGGPPTPARTAPATGGWEELRCASRTCPERTHCLLHERADRFAPEMLYLLFEAVTAECCLGRGRFLGRNATLHAFRPLLREGHGPPHDQVFELIGALGSRGDALGHVSSADGVHGWLTPAESADLAACLDRLDLPVIEPTDEAMSEAHGAVLHGGGFSWPHLTLSFVRIMAHRAAAGGHGLLFGHDVSAGTDTTT